MDGEEDIENARLGSHVASQYIYGTFECPQEASDSADVPIARAVVQSVVASPFHELDDSLPYRRYLTYDELVFAWNAVIIFLIALVVTMVLITVVFAYLYAHGSFRIDKK